MTFPGPRRRVVDLGARQQLSPGDLSALQQALSQPQQEQIGAAPEDPTAHRMAMAEALGGDAFRPTEAPGVLTGAGRVAEILSQYYGQRQGLQREVDEEARDREREEAQRSAIAEALAGFDPNNPQGMVEGLRTQAPEQAFDLATALVGREAPETYSAPFDHNGVQVQQNNRTGQYDPIGNPPAAMIFQPPAGYTGSPEALRPIPGGPADIRQTQEGRARLQQMESSERSLENAISVLTQAEPLVSWDSTGLVGQAMRGAGGTAAFNLEQMLEPVRAILSFENLAEMRRNSATGGALGSIAVRELELLGNTVRSLNTAQGTEQMRGAVVAVRTQLQRTLGALQAARQEMEAGPEAAPMEPLAPEGQERVLQWSPERGVY